jgi:hypothetical protein
LAWAARVRREAPQMCRMSAAGVVSAEFLRPPKFAFR